MKSPASSSGDRRVGARRLTLAAGERAVSVPRSPWPSRAVDREVSQDRSLDLVPSTHGRPRSGPRAGSRLRSPAPETVDAAGSSTARPISRIDRRSALGRQAAACARDASQDASDSLAPRIGGHGSRPAAQAHLQRPWRRRSTRFHQLELPRMMVSRLLNIEARPPAGSVGPTARSSCDWRNVSSRRQRRRPAS